MFWGARRYDRRVAYRDALVAAQAELVGAREDVQVLEERLTPGLMKQLPRRLVRQLAALAERRDDGAASLKAARAELVLLRKYARRLSQALKKAPQLERRYNRQPRRFAKRHKPLHAYCVPDPHVASAQRIRERIHASILEMDPKASLVDSLKKYFDETMDPFLVEACFRSGRAPLRLHVMVPWTASHVSAPHQIPVFYSLLMPVRESAPTVKMKTQTVAAELLSAVWLSKDAEIGVRAIDDMFSIDAEAHALERLMTGDVLAALVAFEKTNKSSLHIGGGLARFEWQAMASATESLAFGVAVMWAVRSVPPVSLLAKRRARS